MLTKKDYANYILWVKKEMLLKSKYKKQENSF